MPIKEFMTREHLVTFDIDDYVDDVKETMSKSDTVISRFWMKMETISEWYPDVT